MWVICTHLCNMKLCKNGILELQKNKTSEKMWGGAYFLSGIYKKRYLDRFQIEMENVFHNFLGKPSKVNNGETITNVSQFEKISV